MTRGERVIAGRVDNLLLLRQNLAGTNSLYGVLDKTLAHYEGDKQAKHDVYSRPCGFNLNQHHRAENKPNHSTGAQLGYDTHKDVHSPAVESLDVFDYRII